MAPRYTVRIPVAPDARRDPEGRVVSRHRTFAGALRSLRRLKAGATAWSPYIWHEEIGARVPPDSRAPMLDAKLNSIFRPW